MADALLQETRNNSGVPQGLVTGPLIFLLFVNDRPSVIHVVTLLFPMTSRRSHHTQKGPPTTIILCHWKSIQIANVIMDSSFSPSIQRREAASKARRMLFMIMQSCAEPSMSVFAVFFNTSRKDIETGSMLLLEPPLPPIYSKANLIRRGRNGLQRSRDFPSFISPPPIT